MCWSNRYTIDRKIADADITCYKAFMPQSIQYSSKWYTFWKRYITKVKAPIINDYIYTIGETQPKVKLCIIYDPYEHTYNIECGYHSCKMIENLNNHFWALDTLVILKCIIPKGTVYYENNMGDIVSETLIVTNYVCKNRS